MSEIRSHPHLLLEDHIRQVQSALGGIFSWHSSKTLTSERKFLAMQAAALHDAGKATEKFQEYIQDPGNFRGDAKLKRHTPLSLLYVLLQDKRPDEDPFHILLLSLVVRGHHGALATLPTSEIVAPTDLDRFSSGDQVPSLKKQLAMWDVKSLQELLGANHGLILSHQLGNSVIRQAEKRLRKVLDVWRKLTADEKMAFRFQTQLVFSLLLEADKAFLAINDPQRYLHFERRQWDEQWIDGYIQSLGTPSTQREMTRHEVMHQLSSATENKLFSLTAPTGIGKTLLAASWALRLRTLIQKTDPIPKVIIVLPYLSIIDQTVRQYEKLLPSSDSKQDKSWLMPSHGLADRTYREGMEDEDESFFIDTWRSELVVTTYDQFLMAIFDDRARYQMRFHNLWDSLIILDEVQTLPTKLWKPLESALTTLVDESDSRVLLMSATLPSIIPHATPLLPNYPDVFLAYQRYQLEFNLEPTTLEMFCEEITLQVGDWLEAQERVLITLNTRAAAREVLDRLVEAWPEDFPQNLYFITADVTPKDRLEIIEEIKDPATKPCVVVSTQTVEAGVDIDMTHVIRDFAPWDSLVQIAGRCNRENKRSREAVSVRFLVNDKGHAYSEQIYDPIHLSITRELVRDAQLIQEETTIHYSQKYFDQLGSYKDTGEMYLHQYIHFLPRDPVRELLRGKDRIQYMFLVLDQDPELKEDMASAQAIQDRWERREAWRKLAGRLARISIQVWARPGFHPNQIGNPCYGDTWSLRAGYYTPKRGLNMEGSTLVF